MIEQKYILITGWLWYIWSHAVVAFEQAGYKTIILDNLVNSSIEVLDRINSVLGYKPIFFECDIRDRTWLEKIFSEYLISWVIHFAWLKAFGESTTYPYMYFDNNVTWSLMLFDVMDRYGVKNIVFSSSASVYDASNIPPFTEDMKLWTTNPYATSKLNIENILRDYSRQKWFKSAVLRYFNLIWAHPSWFLGDYPRSNHGNLSSNIFDVIFWKKWKLYIYGDDFPTPDGTAIRDYIDVCDLIDGHICALRWCEAQKNGKWDVWNLWTWSWYSVNELIQQTEAVTWIPVPTEVIPRRSIDLATPISNPSKVEKDFTWKAKTTIQDSIRHAYAFLSRVRGENNPSKWKKIAHFVPYFPPHSGWVEMYVYEWASNYVTSGWEACIVTFSVWQTAESRNEDGINIIVLPAFDVVHSFPFPMFWLPSFWRGLYRLRSWNPDIIHTHTRFFLSSFLWGIFARLHAKPWIHIEHGSWFVVSSRKIIASISKIYDATLGKWVLKNANEVIAVSEACEHFVREVFWVKKVRTIYRGITPSISQIHPSTQQIEIWYIGRLVDLKWVDILIRAFAWFIGSYSWDKPVFLKIVWDGPERENLENLVEALSLRRYVEFLWKVSVDDVRQKILPSLHVFVNPSFQEWLPTTVIEALIAWCRVIATDVWWTREILRYAPFELIAPRSIHSLAEAITQVVSETDTITQKIPVSLFSWEQTFREFHQVYNQYN